MEDAEVLGAPASLRRPSWLFGMCVYRESCLAQGFPPDSWRCQDLCTGQTAGDKGCAALKSPTPSQVGLPDLSMFCCLLVCLSVGWWESE